MARHCCMSASDQALETLDHLIAGQEEAAAANDHAGFLALDEKFHKALAEAIGTSRSNLSNHLACLRGCGLVTADRAGRHLHYRLVSESFASALRSLVEVAATLPPCDGESNAQQRNAR